MVGPRASMMILVLRKQPPQSFWRLATVQLPPEVQETTVTLDHVEAVGPLFNPETS
jgi:hypothetical protein